MKFIHSIVGVLLLLAIACGGSGGGGSNDDDTSTPADDDDTQSPPNDDDIGPMDDDDTATAICGDDLVQPPEVCEGGDTRECIDERGYPGIEPCATDCRDWQDCIADGVCGDGIAEGPETCDDGDTDPCTADCNADCTGPGIEPACGDGEVQCGEVCDDGNPAQCAGPCNEDCSGAYDFICGNGERECGEVCDDGDTRRCKGTCSMDCQAILTTNCGNGIIECGEVCDDGEILPCRGLCNEDCTGFYSATCGNGIEECGEFCDDGDTNPCTGNCLPDCTGRGPLYSGGMCSDRVICPFEVCDDGNDYACDGCAADCRGVESGCGDDFVCWPEECDDGNTISGDGCSESCRLETGFCRPEKIGAFGGEVTDLLVDGAHLYLGHLFNGLAIYSLQNPQSPTYVGQFDYHPRKRLHPVALARSNNYLVLLDNELGNLYLINVDDPETPSVAARIALPDWIEDLTVSGDLAYLLAEGRMLVVDVAQAETARIVNEIEVPGSPRLIALSGELGWLVTRMVSGDYLVTLDLSLPRVPLLLSALLDPFDAPIGALHATGDRVYVGEGMDGVRLVDGSKPHLPRTVSRIALPGERDPLAIVTRGAIAWVAHRNGFTAIDFSAPDAPLLRASEMAYINYRWNLQIEGDLLYLAHGDRGLITYRVTDADAPNLTDERPTVYDARALTHRETALYMIDMVNGIMGFDVTDPATVKPLWRIKTYVGGEFVALEGDRLYAVSGHDVGIYALDDPRPPTLLGNVGTGETIHGLAVQGELLLVANGLSGGLTRFDVSNPQQPRIVEHRKSQGFAAGVAIDGNTAFVADGDAGLFVLDLSNPDELVELAQLPLPHNAYRLEIAGDYLVITGSSEGLMVVDISTPQTPVLIGTLSQDWWAPPLSLEVDWPLAYIGWGLSLRTVDLSDPTQPDFIPGFGYLGEHANGEIVDGRLFATGMAGQYSGLAVYQTLPGDCTPVCGNAVHETGEECEDGNLLDGDGCAADCTRE